jgi:hypothetical protein
MSNERSPRVLCSTTIGMKDATMGLHDSERATMWLR